MKIAGRKAEIALLKSLLQKEEPDSWRFMEGGALEKRS